jgi:hypothetical protein
MADIFKETIGVQAPSIMKSYENGYSAAKNKFSVTYKYVICGGNIVVASDSEKQAIA